MKRFTKDDIEFHSDDFLGRNSHVAVNIKVYNFGGRNASSKLAEELDIDEDAAVEALSIAFEMIQHEFWYDVIFPTMQLTNVFGQVKCYSEGRSGGWLVPHYRYGNQPLATRKDVESWDAIKVAAYGRFAQRIRSMVDEMTSYEAVKEFILDNELMLLESESVNG